MATRCPKPYLSLLLLPALVLAFAAWADEIQPYPELPPDAKQYLDKDKEGADEEDDSKGRAKGRPNMCQFDCAKASVACSQRCNVEKVKADDPKVTDKKKVVGRKQSDGEKCVAKCGETQNKCMAACK